MKQRVNNIIAPATVTCSDASSSQEIGGTDNHNETSDFGDNGCFDDFQLANLEFQNDCNDEETNIIDKKKQGGESDILLEKESESEIIDANVSLDSLLEIKKIQEESLLKVKEDQKSKKRMRNESEWKKNKRKYLKSSGKSFINVKGQIVPAKTFSPANSCCNLKCYEFINPEIQTEVHNKFYRLADFNLQTTYIFSQVKVKPVARHYVSINEKSKLTTRQYYLPDKEGNNVKICKNLFKKILMVSDGKLDRILKKKINSIKGVPKDQRGRHPPANKTPVEKIDEVCNFIETFPTFISHQSSHETGKKYFGPDFNIRVLYTEYKQKIAHPLSEFKFRDIFKTKFDLHFIPPIVDSSETCDSLLNNGTEQELNVQLQLQEL
ncbi:hypothetical protein PV327_001246 [Microctonus hyperodae]|uniref:Uncharacterized protein n=1 Tax=Microctonus hyperodae TaxID=165561 RepID=A0AA39G7T9_MICHY|nr:hypothetical protein PV327_001246 [Microctonus hyperodae]